jgi:hypothetical protein
MDLLKNLLFMKAKPSEFDKLKEGWRSMVNALYSAGEKPLRFLRYVVLATYGEQKLREDELYKWLVDNEAKVGYSRYPLQFVSMLNDAIRAYLNFMNGRGANGNPHANVESLQLLSGKSTRQHLILLLAGRGLPADVFSALCQDTERLLFVYLVTRRNNREFETLFPTWAIGFGKIKTIEDYRNFAVNTFDRRQRELAARFAREFPLLDLSTFKKFQQRYIVAKLTQAVDLLLLGQHRKATGGSAGIVILPQLTSSTLPLKPPTMTSAVSSAMGPMIRP